MRNFFFFPNESTLCKGANKCGCYKMKACFYNKRSLFCEKETSFDLFACPCLLSCFRLVPYLFHLFASKRPGGIKDELCHVDVVNL